MSLGPELAEESHDDPSRSMGMKEDEIVEN